MELTEHQKRPPEDSVTRIIQTNNATLIPFWGGMREKRQKQEGRREKEREKDGGRATERESERARERVQQDREIERAMEREREIERDIDRGCVDVGGCWGRLAADLNSFFYVVLQSGQS